MKWFSVLSVSLVAEAAAHLLSLTWGFMTLILAFVYVASLLRATTVKANGTESRVNALVPKVGAIKATADAALPQAGGTITGSLTVSGDHLIGGALYGAGFGTLTVGAQLNGTNLTASNSITATNTVTAHNNVQADVDTNTFTLHVNGSRLNMVQSAGGWPLSTGVAWGAPVINVLNNLKTALNNSNVTT